MKYGVNLDENGRVISLIKKSAGKRSNQNFYEFYKEDGFEMVLEENLDLTYFVGVSERDFHNFLGEIIETTEKNGGSIKMKKSSFKAVTKYNLKSQYFSCSGFSEKTPKELCSFFLNTKGIRDIIVLSKDGEPRFILPPYMTEDVYVEILPLDIN
jgi:hypothetical protein